MVKTQRINKRLFKTADGPHIVRRVDGFWNVYFPAKARPDLSIGRTLYRCVWEGDSSAFEAKAKARELNALEFRRGMVESEWYRITSVSGTQWTGRFTMDEADNLIVDLEPDMTKKSRYMTCPLDRIRSIQWVPSRTKNDRVPWTILRCACR